MSKVTLKNGKKFDGYNPPKKKMWWRYLLTWFGGFLSAFLVAGIVALIITTAFSSKEVLTMFGLDPNAILQPYYQGMSILRLATTLPTLKYETLGDIYQITPMIKDVFENTINPILEKEIHFEYNWDEICTKPFKLPVDDREDGSVDTSEELSSYLGRAIKEGVYLKDFITDTVPALVNLFLYPKDDSGEFDFNDPYSLMDYIDADSNFFNRIMDSIKIKDVIDNPYDYPLLREEGGIGGWTLNMFTDENINGLSLGLFIDENSTDPLMVELRQWTVGELKNSTKFDDLSLGLFIGDTTDPIMAKVATWTVGKVKQGISVEDFDDSQLSAFIDSTTDPLLIKLSEYNVGQLRSGSFVDDLNLGLLIGDTDDKFLQYVSDWTVGQLKGGAESLINDICLDLFLPSDSEDKLIQYLSTLKIIDIKNPETFKNIKLADIIPVNDSTPLIIKEIVKDGHTIKWLEETNLYEVFTVGQVFDVTGNTLLGALSDTKLADLEKEETILNLTLGQVLPSTDPDSIVYKFSDKTLSELKNLDVFNITLGEIYSAEQIAANSILKALGADTKIGDLSDPNTLTRLHLGDILTDTSNPIINALKDYTIDEIPSKINTLTLGTLIDVTAPGTPQILIELKDSKLNTIASDINALTLGQILSIDTTDPNTTQLMKTLAGKTIDQLSDFLTHIKLGDVMDFTAYPNLDNDQVKNTEINDINDLIETLKDHLKLKDVVDIDTSSPQILQTLKEEYLNNLENKISELTLSSFMNIGPTSHPLLKALGGYTLDQLEGAIPNIKLSEIMTITQEGSHPLLYALKDETIATLPTAINEKVQGLKLEDILDIGPTSHPLLISLAGTSLSGLEDAIPNIKLGDLITVDSSTPQLIKTLIAQNATLSNLSSKVTGLKLSDMVSIGDGSPQILKSLKDVYIFDGNALANKISNLQLKDIYTFDSIDSVGGVFKYLWDQSNGELTVDQIPAAVNDLPLTTLLEEYMYIDDVTIAKYKDVETGVYYNYDQLIDDHTHSPTGHNVTMYKRIDAIYWFLLTESGETFDSNTKYYVLGNGANYTIGSGLGNITTNFSYHIQNETLYELYDAGLLDTSTLQRSALNKQFIDPNSYSIKTVGNLTMSEFLAICIQFIPAAPNP